MEKTLVESGPHPIEAMPFIPTKALLTTGTFDDVRLVHCRVDGNVTVNDGTVSKVLVMVEGDGPRSIPKGCIVTINAGTFDLA